MEGEAQSTGDKTTPEPAEDGEGTLGDVPGYQRTPEDLHLREVYGYWVHVNPGTHLDGGVKDDSAWQPWWRDLVVMPSSHYGAPSEKVRRRFVGTLGDDMQGVWDRRWKSKQFIAFQTVILQQARHVTACHAIRRRIDKRLNAWGEGKHVMLVEDALRLCKEYLTVARREETAEHRAQTYHSLVLCDHGEGDGWGSSAGGKVYENGGPSDGGATHQTPRGPDTYRG